MKSRLLNPSKLALLVASLVASSALANPTYTFRKPVQGLVASATSQTPNQPRLALDTTQIVFPNTAWETQSVSILRTITNTGSQVIEGLQVATTPNFSATTTCGNTLDPGQSCGVRVGFTPVPVDLQNANLTGVLLVQSTNTSGFSVDLSGYAFYLPSLDWLPSPHPGFEPTYVNTTSAWQTEWIAIARFGNIRINSVTLSGQDAAQFQVVSNSCSGVTLSDYYSNTSSSCSMHFVFSPTSTGWKTAKVVIVSSDDFGNGPRTAEISISAQALP